MSLKIIEYIHHPLIARTITVIQERLSPKKKYMLFIYLLFRLN